jgi:hypothetical protein
MPSFIENLESLNLPKVEPLTIPTRAAMLANRLGLALALTSPSIPEEYAVTKDGQPSGFIHVRWGHVSVDYPDAADENLYQGGAAGFGGFTDHERESQLLFALGLIADRILAG